MHHIVYKVTNLINSKIYVGVHSTPKIDDGYLGSGKLIAQAIKKYGKKNFKKEILHECSSIDDALILEKFIVDEKFLKDENTYNICLGGGKPPRKCGVEHPQFGFKRPDSSLRMKKNNPSSLPHVVEMLKSTSVVKFEDGTFGRVRKGEVTEIPYQQMNKGKITVRDLDGNCFHAEKNDPRWKTGEIKHVTKGRILTCPHCQKTGGNTMKRWHFKNCRNKL